MSSCVRCGVLLLCVVELSGGVFEIIVVCLICCCCG